MRFKNEEERMQHPQVSLIPLPIWQDYELFNCTTSPFVVSLMQAQDTALPDLIREGFADGEIKIANWDFNKQGKESVWLAIALSHKRLSYQQLQEAAQCLHIAPESLLYLVAAWGNVVFFKLLISESLVINNSDNLSRLFGIAARYGHETILEYLAVLAQGKLQEIIAAEKYRAFRWAAENGHMAILEYLAELAPGKLQEMIAAENYFAFRWAAANGHMAILEYLAKKAPDKRHEMIAAENYDAFCNAAENGHKAILEYLAKEAPDKLQKMIAALDYLAFRWAAQNGHKAILEYLAKEAPDKLQEMIAAENYLAFLWAAQNGHMAILEWLAELAPGKLQNMIAAQNYLAFGWAAENGHKAILEYLAKKAPGKLQEMISANNYSAFYYAAHHGHKGILEYLAEQAPDKLEDMIAAKYYEAFRHTAQKGNKDLIQQWLKFPKIFSYAEEHDLEYGSKYIYPFVQQKLKALKTRKAAFEQATPNEPFNIDNEEEAKLLFYVLRNHIRRNSKTLQDDINFLLQIPAVKALATPEQDNELLDLALWLNNESAVACLLQLPSIRDLAQCNDFYRDERSTQPQQFFAAKSGSNAPTFSNGFGLFAQKETNKRELAPDTLTEPPVDFLLKKIN